MKTTPQQIKITTDEIFQIKKKKLNVIISGLREKDNEIENFVKAANGCFNLNRKLCQEDIIRADRLGQKNFQVIKPRLLCIQVQNMEIKRDILEMWKKPKEIYQQIEKIFIRPDLTKNQIEKDKKLREELKILGKDKFVISRGKIIPRKTNEHFWSSQIKDLSTFGENLGNLATGETSRNINTEEISNEEISDNNNTQKTNINRKLTEKEKEEIKGNLTNKQEQNMKTDIRIITQSRENKNPLMKIVGRKNNDEL